MMLLVLVFDLIRLTEGVRIQAKASRGDVAWHGLYGPCSSGCGRGTSELTGMMCKKTGYLAAAQEAVSSSPVEAPTELCEKDANLTKPASSIACVSDEFCEFRLGDAPSSACGWKEVFCAEKDKPDPVDSHRDPLAEFCLSAQTRQISPLSTKEDFKYRFGVESSGCPAQTLQNMCVLTINQVSADKPLANYKENLNQAQYKAEDAINKCDSDIVVIAVQEMTNTFKNMFSEFASETFLTGLKTTISKDYVEVGRCGGDISAGLVVLAKRSVRDFLAPVQGPCEKNDEKYGAKGAWTNTKGTVFLELFTVRGVLLAASTHGYNGDDTKPRLDMISAASHYISGQKPAMVAWAGDFNQRTQLDSALVDKLKSVGTTHAPASELSASHVDESGSGKLKPEAAYDLLFNTPDYFAEGKTLSEVIHETSEGFLAEVDGVRKLCPTYKKRFSPGSWEENGKTVPGTANKWGFFGDKQYGWKPHFACKAPGSSYGVEYYPNPADGKTKWPKHAPSWTERIVVHSGIASNCKAPQKAIPLSNDDHDALFVSCVL